MWHNRYIVNIAVALAVSLVVNLSYFMVLVLSVDSSQSQIPEQQQQRQQQQQPPLNPSGRGVGGGAGAGAGGGEQRMMGVITIAEDGSYGNIINSRGDTIYVERSRIRQYGLQDGDTLRFTTMMSRRYNMANPSLYSVSRINNVVVAPPSMSDARDPAVLMQQILYYFILSVVIIVIITERRRGVNRRIVSSVLRVVGVLLFALVVLYLLAPQTMPRRVGSGLNIEVLGRYPLDFMLLLRWSFALIVSLLYSYLSLSIGQHQRMKIENEQLKTENITTRYNVLMNQVNPHFFFNSLNSLSMLVREDDKARSLTYIDQLSYTFRYILQSGELRLTPLAEEMRFVEAYIYLFEIRYGSKLSFNIDIEERYKRWLIPPLSLQPLLDNAVKHNVITTAKPFRVDISVKDGMLIVSNEIRPKIEKEPSTGIGIENLRKRWALLVNRQIEVSDTDGLFVVKLPMIKVEDESSNS